MHNSTAVAPPSQSAWNFNSFWGDVNQTVAWLPFRKNNTHSGKTPGKKSTNYGSVTPSISPAVTHNLLIAREVVKKIRERCPDVFNLPPDRIVGFRSNGDLFTTKSTVKNKKVFEENKRKSKEMRDRIDLNRVYYMGALFNLLLPDLKKKVFNDELHQFIDFFLKPKNLQNDELNCLHYLLRQASQLSLTRCAEIYKGGNCEELAAMAHLELLKYKDTLQKWGKNIEVFLGNNKSGADAHVFIAIGRDPKSPVHDMTKWGSETIIVDPWLPDPDSRVLWLPQILKSIGTQKIKNFPYPGSWDSLSIHTRYSDYPTESLKRTTLEFRRFFLEANELVQSRLECNSAEKSRKALGL